MLYDRVGRIHQRGSGEHRPLDEIAVVAGRGAHESLRLTGPDLAEPTHALGHLAAHPEVRGHAISLGHHRLLVEVAAADVHQLGYRRSLAGGELYVSRGDVGSGPGE